MPKRQPTEIIQRRLKRLGAAIRQARENLRYSYRELSEHSGVSASQILRMESGEFDFSITNFLSVATNLGLPPGIVLEWAAVPVCAPSDFKNHDESDEMFMAAGSWNDSAAYTQRIDDLINFVAAAAEACVELILSGNPILFAASVEFRAGRDTFKPLSERVCGLASKIDVRASNLERDAQIKSLREKPYPKLVALGVLDQTIVDQFFVWRKTHQDFFSAQVALPFMAFVHPPPGAPSAPLPPPSSKRNGPKRETARPKK